MKNTHTDLIAQRAASLARIEELKEMVNGSAGFERSIWEGMLAQYERSISSLDSQIAYFAK